MIYEQGWDTRILKEFEDATVGMVGFTGALGHGTPNLYTNGYYLPNLARQNFMSNLRDAEKHGQRFSGERDVAVCDGLGIFVRRIILDQVGGWKKAYPYAYWLYAEFLACEVRRQGYRIRMVGIECEHLGGKSSEFIAASPTYDMMKLIYSYLKTTRMFYPSASIISDIFPSWQDGIFQKQIRKHWPRNINAVKDSWIYPENMGWVVLRYSAY